MPRTKKTKKQREEEKFAQKYIDFLEAHGISLEVIRGEPKSVSLNSFATPQIYETSDISIIPCKYKLRKGNCEISIWINDNKVQILPKIFNGVYTDKFEFKGNIGSVNLENWNTIGELIQRAVKFIREDLEGKEELLSD